eukprot:CAMPEP_0113872718 /NCGR_PEP_ID=MMETSP0780_2-20120614/3369_1 /TAXON_ID=652834 /ORGANISM="Palpitomonas bilix" /LENGTH=159 /DNA_ID=CAMNT_0000858281 /DNA_START=85 /DNA_END=564 /DNA_ORIENTATION=+ /assembly_acc=CAM_ASM_000599
MKKDWRIHALLGIPGGFLTFYGIEHVVKNMYNGKLYDPKPKLKDDAESVPYFKHEPWPYPGDKDAVEKFATTKRELNPAFLEQPFVKKGLLKPGVVPAGKSNADEEKKMRALREDMREQTFRHFYDSGLFNSADELTHPRLRRERILKEKGHWIEESDE